MTPADVEAVAGEIATWATSRVRAVHQDGPHRFRLALEGEDGRRDVVLDLDPTFPRCHLAAPARAPAAPSPLAATLRRHLRGGRVADARAVPGERALAIHVVRPPTTWTVWFEGFGRGANLYLVDEEGTVRLTPRGHIAARRAAAVGAPFVPVPPAAAPDGGPPPGEDASDAVAAAAGAARHAEDLARRRHALARRARTAARRAARRVDTLERAAAAGAEAEAWQRRGEQLQAAFPRLVRGRSRIRVPDLFGPDPTREVEVDVDPYLEPAAQVAACFRRARRARRRAAEAGARLPAARRDLDGARAACEALAEGNLDGAALDALEAELGGAAAPPAAAAPQARPWRTFTSADGWTILVGKDARGNDRLTRERARPQDLFLHVRGLAGSHVLVPTDPGRTVPKETLLDAAALAAHFSAAGKAAWIEVDHTPWRHVRRPRGAPPGTVILQRAKTLRIRPDAARRARLLGGSG